MSLSSEPSSHTTSGRFTSPDLRLRDSTTLWGPLQLTVFRHREGTELGYRAGEEAYQQLVQQHGQDIGLPSAEAFYEIMETYFALPRHRPRTITAKITDEWRAMFVLGWTSQVLQAPSFLHGEAATSFREGQPPNTARYQYVERTR